MEFRLTLVSLMLVRWMPLPHHHTHGSPSMAAAASTRSLEVFAPRFDDGIEKLVARLSTVAQPSLVSVSVASASVQIVATILVPPGSTTAAVSSAVQSAMGTPLLASTLFGVTINTVAVVGGPAGTDSGGGGGGGGGLSIGVVAGAAAGGALLLIALLFVIWNARRARRTEVQKLHFASSKRMVGALRHEAGSAWDLKEHSETKQHRELKEHSDTKHPMNRYL